MYAWATKEYLLWKMSIGQILLYHNKGINIKNGVNEDTPGLVNKSIEELKKMREEYKQLYGYIG